MIRPSLLIPALAIAALLTAAPVAASAAAKPKPQSTVSVDFELSANHGLDAQVETFAGQTTLEITDKHHLVSYQVHGETTEAGLKARFGKLGLIDVVFTPTKTLSTTQPPKGCEGEPWTKREGLFTGTIEFSGEREYVRIEATQAKGEMNVASGWRCSNHKRPTRIKGAPRLSAQGFRGESGAEKEQAALSASSHRCRCGLVAFTVRNRKGRGPSVFYGVKAENREGMKISRVTVAYAGASAFAFDHAAGTATVRPPQPFSGHGVFERRPHGRDLWRSTMRVPLLGADALDLRGHSFRATLHRDLPGD